MGARVISVVEVGTELFSRTSPKNTFFSESMMCS